MDQSREARDVELDRNVIALGLLACFYHPAPSSTIPEKMRSLHMQIETRFTRRSPVGHSSIETALTAIAAVSCAQGYQKRLVRWPSRRSDRGDDPSRSQKIRIITYVKAIARCTAQDHKHTRAESRAEPAARGSVPACPHCCWQQDHRNCHCSM